MTGGTGTSDRTEARAARREALIDAAIALVRREGPYVSMERIAGECGITKPILYRHFGDRDGLVVAIAHRFVDELVAALAPLAASDAAAEPLLRATIDAYLALVERDPNLYRFVSTHAGAERRDLVARLVAEQVGIVLEQRLAAAGLDTEPARPWAYALVGMVHFAGDWWVDEHPVSRDRLGALLTQIVWDGAGALGLDPPATQPRSTRPPRRRTR